MLFSRRKPQLLGALSALLFGGQTARAITLDLGDTGTKLPSAIQGDLVLPAVRVMEVQVADSGLLCCRFHQGSSSYNSQRHDELL